MNIIKEENESKGVFKALDGEKIAGAITYSQAGINRIIVDHTEIDDAYRGQSVGKKIVHAIVEDARNNGYKILPLCPFAKSVFDKDETLRDVL